MGSACQRDITAHFPMSQLLIRGNGSLEPLSMTATGKFDRGGEGDSPGARHSSRDSGKQETEKMVQRTQAKGVAVHTCNP